MSLDRRTKLTVRGVYLEHLNPRTRQILPVLDGIDLDVFDGELVRVATDRGAITLPVVVTEMVDHVVWLPLRSAGSQVHATLGAVPGDVVTLSAAEPTGAARTSLDGGESA